MVGAGLYLLADYVQLAVIDSALLPFVTLIILSVVNIVLIAFLVPETTKERTIMRISKSHPLATLTNIVRAKHVRHNLLLIFWFIFALTLFTSFTPTYLTEAFASDQSQTAAIILVFSLLIALSQAVLIPLLIKRISKLQLVSLAFVIASVSVFTLTQITTVAGIYVLLLPTAVAVGILYVTLLSSVSLKGTASQQGEYMGAAISTQTLAQMIPGAVIAVSAFQFGVTAPLIVSAFLFLCAGVILSIVRSSEIF